MAQSSLLSLYLTSDDENSLTSIIISRFMLNLKQIASSQGASVDTGDLSVIFFSSGTFVENMGESLHFASNDEVDGQSL